MLKKVIEKIAQTRETVRRWLDERRRARLLYQWDDVERFLDNTAYNKGALYMSTGKYKEAVKMFKKKVQQEPEGSLGWYMLGEAYWQMGEKEHARESYKKAWSCRRGINERYVDGEHIKQDIQEALARSGVAVEASDADHA